MAEEHEPPPSAKSTPSPLPVIAPPEGMELPELPSELLLHIFSHLPSWTLLFSVRPVCRRWRELALEPALWEGRSLLLDAHPPNSDGSYFERRLAPRVLLLAPCLGLLSLKQATYVPAALRGACAVTRLQLDLFCASGARMEAAEALLQRQAELGGLREVVLSRVPAPRAEACARLALGADLVGLTVSVTDFANYVAVPDPSDFPASPRLRALHFSSDSKHNPWLERLLEAHVASLESVTLNCRASLRVFQLLAACPRLRVADLPDRYVDEVGDPRALSGLPPLEDLTLRVRRKVSQPLAPHFRSATQLRRLSIECSIYGLPSSVLELVEALGWSGQSRLATLQLVGRFTAPATALARLPRLLSWLPQLHTLDLFDTPPVGALDGISPVVVPGLRLLRIGGIVTCGAGGEGQQCAVVALHELVRRKPLLHVMAPFRPHFNCVAPQCACCAGRMHPSAHFPGRFARCLFAHGPAEECGCAAHSQHAARCAPDRCKCSHFMERVPEVPRRRRSVQA